MQSFEFHLAIALLTSLLHSQDYVYCSVPMLDNETFTMHHLFDRCFEFIDSAIQTDGVLVHWYQNLLPPLFFFGSLTTISHTPHTVISVCAWCGIYIYIYMVSLQ